VRNAFTLVEVLVALVLLEIGMLALSGVAAVAARDFVTATRILRASAIASRRIEMLRGIPCPAPASGAQQTGFATEYWRVEATKSARLLRDSVEFGLGSGRNGHVVRRGAVWCRD
jgi:Tfp pilus assembly protein PilV